MAEQFTVLIMAAGHGTRMRSSVPKVLHPVAGKPMVHWVIEAARGAGASRILCITRPGDGVAEGLPEGVEVVEQQEGEGTGAAVLAARDQLAPDETVVVLSADHPLVERTLIEELLASHAREGAAATVLTTEELDPAGYGRIVRGPQGSVERIVETKHTNGLARRGARDPRGQHRLLRLRRRRPHGCAATTSRRRTGRSTSRRVFPVLAERGKDVATHKTTTSAAPRASTAGWR